jgi:hypothetical protein
MIKAEQIPPDAMYAAWKAMNAGMTLNDAIAAAINAWPGMLRIDGYEYGVPDIIHIPLTKEPNDD